MTKHFLSILLAVAVAAIANSIAAVWARPSNRFSGWLVLLVVISPIVFITFGLVTTRVGVAVASGTVDALLTVTTIVIGLIAFREWNKISPIQYLGIGLALLGIALMLFGRKSDPGG